MKHLLLASLTVALAFTQTTLTSAADLKAVPLKSGTATLSPSNTSIGFVGTHEGTKPDPRTGGFEKFSGEVTVKDGELAAVSFEIDTASLWTEIPKLTNHLKSPDFFDVREYPSATFESTDVASEGDGKYVVTGKLTLLKETKEIKVPVTTSVSNAGLTLTSAFEFDRTAFGMTYGDGKVKKNVEMTVNVGQATSTK